MRTGRRTLICTTGLLLMVLSACGPGHHGALDPSSPPQSSGPAATPTTSATPTATPTKRKKKRRPQPQAGNPNGHATPPVGAADTSHPDHVIGTGTKASCTSAAVVAAVAAGGVITFRCGPAPVTITMAATAKVHNHTSRVVIDGGGKVTLSGGGARRILYMNTCDDALGSIHGNCTVQDHPQVTVQNLTFADGNSTGEHVSTPGGIGGGSGIFAFGGRLTVVNARFLRGRCDPTGPDLGGGAIRTAYQPHPATIVKSTFSGGRCTNGGALSSLHSSWAVYDSLFTGNDAIGHGANPARAGTPGGGNGGAIYCDGDTYTLRIEGSVIADNHANEGGGAIFFVSNDRTGHLIIKDSSLVRDVSQGFHTDGFPGIFYLGKTAKPEVN